ncbi:septal ring lytic transglycosylase RlpA family protein [Albibacterium indicum]|uniref:septal ring lytic transglycosylase RlpA family protein n=1 Tax=Albibacterium indicum TaxID=2292082 RepID=UPI000E4AA5DC|nr:septal ring lytic transglycosylase RlpA family protein [Pedobacter indicus]
MKFALRVLLILFIAASVTSCAPKITQRGKASYYADKFKNRPTASGERYKPGRLTAAHKTLPFGTKVTVINRQNGQRVKVVINDRGPFVSGRIIDVSRKAAKRLNMIRSGVVDVQIKYKRPKSKR